MSTLKRITYPVGKAEYDGPGNFSAIKRQIKKDLGRERSISEKTIHSIIVACFTEAGLGRLLRENKSFNIPRLGKFHLPEGIIKKRKEELKEKKKRKLEYTRERLEKYQQKRKFLDAFDKINKRRAEKGWEPLKLEDFIVWYKKIEWPKYSPRVRDKVKTDYNGRKWKPYVMFCRPYKRKKQ